MFTRIIVALALFFSPITGAMQMDCDTPVCDTPVQEQPKKYPVRTFKAKKERLKAANIEVEQKKSHAMQTSAQKNGLTGTPMEIGSNTPQKMGKSQPAPITMAPMLTLDTPLSDEEIVKQAVGLALQQDVPNHTQAQQENGKQLIPSAKAPTSKTIIFQLQQENSKFNELDLTIEDPEFDAQFDDPAQYEVDEPEIGANNLVLTWELLKADREKWIKFDLEKMRRG